MQLTMTKLTTLMPEEDVLKAVFECGPVSFHGYFIRVEEDDQVGQVPTNDPCGRFDDLCRMDPNGAFETTKVEGHEGDYVLVLTPFQK